MSFIFILMDTMVLFIERNIIVTISMDSIINDFEYLQKR